MKSTKAAADRVEKAMTHEFWRVDLNPADLRVLVFAARELEGLKKEHTELRKWWEATWKAAHTGNEYGERQENLLRVMHEGPKDAAWRAKPKKRKAKR